jgi:hypothetical protein
MTPFTDIMILKSFHNSISNGSEAKTCEEIALFCSNINKLDTLITLVNLDGTLEKHIE